MIDVNEIYRTVQDKLVKAEMPDDLRDFPQEDAEKIRQNYFCITLIREMFQEYHHQLMDELHKQGIDV